jgi:tape measure domain-containing protein
MAVKNILFKIQADTKNIDAQLKNVTDEINQLKKAVDGVNKSISDLNKKGSAEMSNFGKTTQQAGKQFSQFGSIVKGGLTVLGIQSATQALKDFTLEAVRAAAEFQKNQIAFKTFIGSTQQANKVLTELVDLAIKTPFTSEQTIQAGRVLAAYGFNAAQLVPIIKRLGNISAGTQIPLEQLALVFGQIKAAGKLMGQDLLQLVNAGFNPLQEISERTGESMAALRKRMGEGKISFEEVAESITYATERGGRFYDLNNKLAETTAGKIDQLRERWQLFTRETGTALEPITNGFVELASSILNATNQVVGFIQAIGKLVPGGIERWLKDSKEDVDGYAKSIEGAKNNVNSLISAVNKLTGLRIGLGKPDLPSTFIPKQEEQDQIKRFDAIKKKLDSSIVAIKLSGKAVDGVWSYNIDLVDKFNEKYKGVANIDKKRILDQTDLNALSETAYLDALKYNDEQTKKNMYEQISIRANNTITNLEKDKLKFVRQGLLGQDAVKFINEEIERLRQLILEAEIRSVKKIKEEGDGLSVVDQYLGKIKIKWEDLYKGTRSAIREIDKLNAKVSGKGEMDQMYNAQVDYFSKVDELNQEHAVYKFGLKQDEIEANRRYEEELMNINSQSTLSDDKKQQKKKRAGLQLQIDLEAINRKELAADIQLGKDLEVESLKFEQNLTAIRQKYDAERRKAANDGLMLDLKNEEEYYNDRIELYNQFIEDTKKDAEKAKTGRQFRMQLGFLDQNVREQNRNIENRKQARLAELNAEEDDLLMRELLEGASAEKLGEIEKEYNDKRLKVTKEADDEIAKLGKAQTDFIIEQQKIRREAILDGWTTLIGEISSGLQELTSAIEAQAQRQIEAQNTRVEKAREIADKGNAEILQMEEDRLEKLNEKRRKAARAAIAIAKTEAIAQSALAVAKAAGQTGAGAPFAIAATITALVTGIAAAAVAVSNAGWAKGGYTGDGGKYEPAGTVHKGEFVFSKEKTAKYRPLFEEIHKGRDPFTINGFNDKIVVINNNDMGDRLDRIEKAILGQSRMQVNIDEKGIYGIVSEMNFKQNRLRARF